MLQTKIYLQKRKPWVFTNSCVKSYYQFTLLDNQPNVAVLYTLVFIWKEKNLFLGKIFGTLFNITGSDPTCSKLTIKCLACVTYLSSQTGNEENRIIVCGKLKLLTLCGYKIDWPRKSCYQVITNQEMQEKLMKRNFRCSLTVLFHLASYNEFFYSLTSNIFSCLKEKGNSGEIHLVWFPFCLSVSFFWRYKWPYVRQNTNMAKRAPKELVK